MSLRVNSLRYRREDYLALLRDAGIGAEACVYSPCGIRLDAACDISALPGFGEGACSVQDEASQLAAPLLQPAGREYILDSCAAPGGKTGHILELSATGTRLDAVEIDDHRLQRIRENIDRLQLSARLIHGDASQPSQWWNGEAYDAILLDAPCSASGVIRRHPDIKVLRQPGDLDKLHRLQVQLLHALWRCLRPGGSMVFTTCSVFEEENDRSVDALLQSFADARCEAIAEQWGTATRYGRQLLPCETGPDGFYFARLYKAQSTTGTAGQQ
jgi:16S rRNA (cytosine967-C5)-methyltransferase